jgi:hypothetical protein
MKKKTLKTFLQIEILYPYFLVIKEMNSELNASQVVIQDFSSEMLQQVLKHALDNPNPVFPQVCRTWTELYNDLFPSKELEKVFQNPEELLPSLGSRVSKLWQSNPKLAKRILRLFLQEIKPLTMREKLKKLHALLKTYERPISESPFIDIVSYLYKNEHSSNVIRLPLSSRYLETPLLDLEALPIMNFIKATDESLLKEEIPPDLIERLLINPRHEFHPEELVVVDTQGTLKLGFSSLFYGRIIEQNPISRKYKIKVLYDSIEYPANAIGKIPSEYFHKISN